MSSTSRKHLLWPAAIVVLLVSSVVMMMGVLYAAKSDGGARVVTDYYSRAVGWDSLKAVQAESDALGWTSRVRFQDADLPGEVSLTLVLLDSEGLPVPVAGGEVVLSRPHESEPVARFSFDDAINRGDTPAAAQADGFFAMGIPRRAHSRRAVRRRDLCDIS